jgi:hypothetical protein
MNDSAEVKIKIRLADDLKDYLRGRFLTRRVNCKFYVVEQAGGSRRC